MEKKQEIKFDERNYRKHSKKNKALIKKSLEELGAGRSVVIDADDTLVAGNGVYEQAQALQMPVRVVETDGSELVVVKRTDIHTQDEKRRKLALADNAASDLSEWDVPLIETDWAKDVLADWGVELPGFETMSAEEAKDVQEDDFDEEKDKMETVCKKGDIWLLGKHRLMCGDSTDPEQVKRLLGKETPDLIYTDPPYGMNAVSNSGVLKEKYKTDIHGDDDNSIAIKAFGLCQTLFPNARQVWWGANYYTECLPSSECWLVWDKNNGMSDQTDCELAWSNFRSVVRQFTMVSEKQNRIHPTQKPCKLFADIVARMKKQETYTKVLDLFGGSGSTMIACEQMGIQSFIMEYDPHFCTEIIARWEQLTNQKATRL